MFSFSKSDKVLVIAPHPDDESLATGGLLQRVFSQKIPVRIVFATNGENNPWAQRYWDRIWRIGPDKRVQWGQRRRQEALNAICSLGGNPDCASCGCIASMGLASVTSHKLGGIFSIGAIFKASVKIGQRSAKFKAKYQARDAVQILQIREEKCANQGQWRD